VAGVPPAGDIDITGEESPTPTRTAGLPPHRSQEHGPGNHSGAAGENSHRVCKLILKLLISMSNVIPDRNVQYLVCFFR
jgi:hypothetical protein